MKIFLPIMVKVLFVTYLAIPKYFEMYKSFFKGTDGWGDSFYSRRKTTDYQ